MQMKPVNVLWLSLALVIAGCTSVPPAPNCQIPEPPAALMQPPSNSIQLLDRIMPISEPASPEQKAK